MIPYARKFIPRNLLILSNLLTKAISPTTTKLRKLLTKAVFKQSTKFLTLENFLPYGSRKYGAINVLINLQSLQGCFHPSVYIFKWLSCTSSSCLEWPDHFYAGRLLIGYKALMSNILAPLSRSIKLAILELRTAMSTFSWTMSLQKENYGTVGTVSKPVNFRSAW